MCSHLLRHRCAFRTVTTTRCKALLRRSSQQHESRVAELERRVESLTRRCAVEAQSRALAHAQLRRLRGRAEVFVRLRPQADDFGACVAVAGDRGDGDGGAVLVFPDRRLGPRRFAVDAAFDSGASDEEFCERAFAPLVDAAYAGTAVAVLVCGALGGGKTHTLAAAALWSATEFLQRSRFADAANAFGGSAATMAPLESLRVCVSMGVAEVVGDRLFDLLAAADAGGRDGSPLRERSVPSLFFFLFVPDHAHGRSGYHICLPSPCTLSNQSRSFSISFPMWVLLSFP